ncbi:PAS domain S-box protein [Filimonas lacunae]|nr:PAS domain S-box protein [Filimonas lacunae]BAV09553.1 GAF domain/sensory box/EAL domain protein [Filimonas lacunae]
MESDYNYISEKGDKPRERLIQDELKISEERFRGAFEYSAIGMAIVSPQGRWIKVNKRLCDFTGCTKDELYAITFQDITHPDDLEADLLLLRELVAGKREYYQIEKRYFHKDGSIVWGLLNVSLVRDEEGNVLHFVSQIEDITDRKIVEEAYKESEQRWQFALEGSGDGIWDWNVQTGEVFYSAQCKAMLGFTENEMGNSCTEWDKRVHPDDKDRYFADMHAHFMGKTTIYTNEHRVMCKDGSYKWVLDRGKVISWTEDGKPLRVLGTHADISEAKEKEIQLKQTLDIISEQNKRLTNFAHIVSHNLRTHTGNLEMLLYIIDETKTEEEKQELMEHLKKVSAQLSETMQHLNDVISIQANIKKQRTVLYLREYIHKATEAMAGEIGLHKALIINNVPAEVTINYSPAYLESILLNCLSNAIKYRHPNRLPVVEVSYHEEGGRKVLEITDNGIGINLARYGQKLFGMYNTFHGNADAKGVGLFITKNQVEAMGGKIEVISEVDKGATFKIFLS